MGRKLQRGSDAEPLGSKRPAVAYAEQLERMELTGLEHVELTMVEAARPKGCQRTRSIFRRHHALDGVVKIIRQISQEA